MTTRNLTRRFVDIRNAAKANRRIGFNDGREESSDSGLLVSSLIGVVHLYDSICRVIMAGNLLKIHSRHCGWIILSKLRLIFPKYSQKVRVMDN